MPRKTLIDASESVPASIPMMMVVIPATTVIPATVRHYDTAAQQHGDAGNQQKGFLHRVHLLGFEMNPA